MFANRFSVFLNNISKFESNSPTGLGSTFPQDSGHTVLRINVTFFAPFHPHFVRVAASVARRRDPSSHKATTGQGGLGNFFPRVALVEQISSLLSPEKAAEGETLRHMSRTTTTHAYHVPVQNPACAGARGAGGGVSTPAKTHKFCAQPLIFQEFCYGR